MDRRRLLMTLAFSLIAITTDAGIRWSIPAGSHYADGYDPPEARGAFVHHGALHTLLLRDGAFAVQAWRNAPAGWTPWSAQQPKTEPHVAGEIDHVRVRAPGVIEALVDIGAVDGDEIVRQFQWWSVSIDDRSRTLRWTPGARETHDLSTISNYASEAMEYFARLNAERLHLQRSPARIWEMYVIGAAVKDNAIAFAAGDELRVYTLPDPRPGLVAPAKVRRYAIRMGHVAPTPDGWMVVADLRGSWAHRSLLFVDHALQPTGVIPLSTRSTVLVEPAGRARIAFGFYGHRDAWRIDGSNVRHFVWSTAVPEGHIAATNDDRWLFLTNGRQVATPTREKKLTAARATGLRVGKNIVVVSPMTKAIVWSMPVIVPVAAIVWGRRRRRRRHEG